MNTWEKEERFGCNEVLRHRLEVVDEGGVGVMS